MRPSLSSPTVPRAPFADWPIQLYDARFGFAWFTEPCTFINQLVHPTGTVEVASSLHDAIDHVIAREWARIDKCGGLTIIHDWRKMSDYTSEARVEYLARMKRRDRKYLRNVVAILPDRPLLKMAVQTANIVMALSTGGRLKVTTQALPTLTEQGVQRPARGGWT